MTVSAKFNNSNMKSYNYSNIKASKKRQYNEYKCSDQKRNRIENNNDSFSSNKFTEINSMNYMFFKNITDKINPNNNDKEMINTINTLNIDNNWNLYDTNLYSCYMLSNNVYKFVNLSKIIIKDIKLSNILNFSIFQYLKHLELSDIELSHILDSSFKFPKNIECITISKCNITKIPNSIYDLEYLSELYLNHNNINYISDKIKNLKKLKYLNLGGNNISNIPSTFSELSNLECLSFNNCPINIVDSKITNLINLKKLLLNNCSLIYIDDSFSKLINLEGLDLANNPKLHYIPENINKCTRLSDVCLENIGLYELPDKFFDLRSLERLKLTNNPLSKIQNEIGNLNNLKFLEIHNTKITSLPEEMGNLINMEDLYLHGNYITNIPHTFSNMKKIVNLDVNNNQISNLEPIFENLTNLKYLNISENNIVMLPTNIIYAKNLMKFKYYNNPLMTIQPQVKRFIENIKNSGNFIRDTQSIHNSNVQRNLVKSIEHITSLPLLIDKAKIVQDIINDNIITKECKTIIGKDFKNNEYHSVLKLNFREIFEYVWSYIHNTKFDKATQEEIKKILNTELIESKELCFIGKITRLVGALNGFCDLVVITISDSEYISNTIIHIKDILNRNGEYTVDKHRELVKNDLLSYGISNDIIDNWLEYITE